MTKDRIEESMNKILEYVQNAATFVETEAPLVVQELLNYSAIKYGLIVGVGGIVFIALLAIIVISLMRIKDWNDPWQNANDAARIGLSFACVVPCFAGLICVLGKWDELLMVLTAPRLYVLEFIRGLI